MAKDPHAARKKAISDRAKKAKSPKVRRYATKDLFEKMDQAGDHAGVWLESLESNFDALIGKPQGTLRSFSEKDFDILFTVMFGYRRDERGQPV
jgi:hypothetical protein